MKTENPKIDFIYVIDDALQSIETKWISIYRMQFPSSEHHS